MPSPDDHDGSGRDRITPFGLLAAPGAAPPHGRSYWVVEGRLAGGAYPYQPDPTDGDATLRLLRSAGITAFVDLTQARLPGSWESHLLDYHPSARSLGLEVARRPIRDMGVPTVDEAIGTLDEIDRLLADGQTVYVHCWGGIGRTGLTIGTWLIRHGVATGESVQHLLNELRAADEGAGHIPAPQTREQRAFLYRFSG
jgi:hypothetical protein